MSEDIPEYSNGHDELEFFKYDHLPNDGDMKAVSKKFHDLAHELVNQLPESNQLNLSLQLLLQAKDAAVRAAMPRVV